MSMSIPFRLLPVGDDDDDDDDTFIDEHDLDFGLPKLGLEFSRAAAEAALTVCSAAAAAAAMAMALAAELFLGLIFDAAAFLTPGVAAPYFPAAFSLAVCCREARRTLRCG